MTTTPVDPAGLYFQLCLAAEEYTSFRNMMLVSPDKFIGTCEAALQRADKVAALLRQLRERQVVAFMGASGQPPMPPADMPAPQAPPQTPAPTLAPPPAPPPSPTPPPQGQPVGPQYAWMCPVCQQKFGTPTATSPTQCPHCKVELAG